MNIKGLTLNNYQSIYQYVPSVKELMPLYNYLYPKDDPQNLKNYLSMVEINDHLKNLNEHIDLLNQRVKVSIISGNGQPTVNSIPVVEVNDEFLWVDGKPDPIDPVRNDMRGDKRVLLSSSEIEGVFDRKVLDYDHGSIVDQSAPIIANKLNEEVDKIFESPPIDSELSFWFASPVDVEIEDPNGKVIAKNLNEIENGLAQYSGESKPDGFKFISIPNPVKGDYKIKLTGNGNGEFHAGSIYADYKNDIPDQESLTKGIITEGQIVEYKLEYNPDNTGDPVGEIKPMDVTPPTITGYAMTEPNANGWYNQDVVIHFETTDAESGIESVTSDVTISTEGANQSVTGTATDKAGNTASFTVGNINIDKTSPEITIFSPEERVYINDEILAIDYKAEDFGSGITNNNWQVEKDGQVLDWHKKSIDLSLEHLGSYAFKVFATDEAENSAEASIEFQIITNLDAIQKNLSHYFEIGLVKKEIAYKYFSRKLKNLEELFNLLEKTKNSKSKSKSKQAFIEALERMINANIDRLIRQINRKTPQWIDQKATDLLIEDLNYIKFSKN